MLKIVHMTDLHIRPSGETVIDLDPEQRLLQAICSINSKHPDARLCVITGDLTDRGDIEAYRVLRRCLAQLCIPWRLLLGNHDDRANFRMVFPDAPVDPCGYVQSIEDAGDLRLIFLDTLDSENSGGSGILCPHRMSWLAQTLEEAGGRRALIFMHHPPKSVQVKWFDGMLLKSGAEFMSMVANCSSVAHVAFGHIHLTTAGSWGATSFSANRGTCHKIALNLTAQRLDWVRDGPAYDIILADREEVIVHHIDPVGAMELLAFETMSESGSGTQFHKPEGRTDATIEC